LRQKSFALFALALLVAPGCSDPPNPPPLPGPPDMPHWSSAPHVVWSGPGSWSDRPGVIVVERTGGPLDLLLHEADLATFLNDRFQAWFLTPDAAPPPLPSHGVVFVSASGCILRPAVVPQTATNWVELANEVLVDLAEGQSRGQAWPSTPIWVTLTPAPGHPLHLRCPELSEAPEP